MDFLLRRPGYKLKKNYKFGKTLGVGTFGNVKEALWTAAPDGKPLKVAAKLILKKSVKGQESIVYDEIECLQGLNHPNVVKLHEWFESREKFYMIFQLASGGELFERICDRGKFTEADSIDCVRATLSGVRYLHSKDVVHRDLKPENILYESPESDNLLIADFGIARHLASPDEVLTTLAGSPGYAAPEVLTRKGHGKPVDMWAVGVITYTLLCGYSPFRADNRQELIAETTRAKVEFHDKYWSKISKEAKDFVCALIRADPQSRLTADEALKHPWLAKQSDEDVKHDISAGLKENWVARKRWKKAISGVQAAVRLQRSLGAHSGGGDVSRDSSDYDNYDTASDDDFGSDLTHGSPASRVLSHESPLKQSVTSSAASTLPSPLTSPITRNGNSMSDAQAREAARDLQTDMETKMLQMEQKARELSVRDSH